MRAFFGIILTIAAAIATASCSTPSALGNGTFNYECVATPGASCSGGSSSPSTLPVGAQFKLTYTASTPSTYPSVAVDPVSTNFFRVQNGVWTALLPGSPAAYATAGGLALDYTFFHIEAPAKADAQ